MSGVDRLYMGIHVMIVEMFTRGAFQELLIANLQPKNLSPSALFPLPSCSHSHSFNKNIFIHRLSS